MFSLPSVATQTDVSFWSQIDWMTLLFSAIAATLGATAGAVAAFRMEQRRRDREKTDLQIADGRRLLLDLFSIWNDLVQFKKEVIDELRDPDPQQAWFQMKAIIYPFTPGDRLNINRMEFLLGTDGSQLAADMLIERQRYELFVGQVSERSRITCLKIPSRNGS